MAAAAVGCDSGLMLLLALRWYSALACRLVASGTGIATMPSRCAMRFRRISALLRQWPAPGFRKSGEVGDSEEASIWAGEAAWVRSTPAVASTPASRPDKS